MRSIIRAAEPVAWRNSPLAWGRVSCVIHWVSAILMLAILGFGVAAVNWRMSPLKFDLFVWHKSLGLLMVLLLLVRLAWLRLSPAPVLPDSISPRHRRLARRVRGLIYVLLLAVPVSGWLLNSTAGVPLKWFWWIRVPDLLETDRGLREVLTWVHHGLVSLLVGLILMHVAGAFTHGRAFVSRLCK